MCPDLFSPSRVLLAVIAACGLNVLSISVARWAAGADTDAILSAAIRMAGHSPSSASEGPGAVVGSLLRPLIANYPLVETANTLVLLILLATVFYSALGFVDAGLRWTIVFGATAYATAAQALARLVLTSGLAMLRQPTVEELVEGSFLNASLAPMMPEWSGSVLLAGARELDSLTIVFLLVFVVVSGTPGVSRVNEKTIGAVVGVCFVIWVLMRMAWAAVLGG